MHKNLRGMLVAAVALLIANCEACAQTAIGLQQRPPEISRPSNAESASHASDESDASLKQAQKFLDDGQADSAEQMARRYLVEHPKSAEGHFLLGFIFFKAGKPVASLPEYTAGAKFRDPSAFDLKIVALDYVLLGAYADADSWLTKSLSWNSKDSEGWYYLGRIKYNENRWEEAIQAFQRCLELDPHSVKAEDNLGLSYEGLGRIEEAFSCYRKAIAWQSQAIDRNPAPLIEMGRLLLEQDKPEEAISFLRQAVEIAPLESRAHTQLGKAYVRLDRLEQAQDELEKAVAQDPNHSALHFMLGQVYRKRGMTEKAKFELERGAALSGTKPSTPPSLE